MARVYVALGSNLGDRLAHLQQARERLGQVLNAIEASSVYETDPVGYLDQGPFLNAVVGGTTQRSPLELLQELQRVEQALGRERSFANAPRTIDLDLLFYDALMFDTPELRLPHPRLYQRFFVLVPLAELAPDLRHPRFGLTMRELLRARGEPTGIRSIGTSAQW